jgi:hypothetical protein
MNEMKNKKIIKSSTTPNCFLKTLRKWQRFSVLASCHCNKIIEVTDLKKERFILVPFLAGSGPVARK